MIYKDSRFKKEIKKSYIDSLSSRKGLLLMCVILGLLTLAFQMLLNTLYKSVLSEYLPQIILPQSYTLIFSYNLIAYVFFIIFFIIRYESMTLVEIKENKWYLLSKMGYNTSGIIIYKMFASTAIVLLVYCVGFILSAAIASFLKFTFEIAYLLPAFISGAIGVLLVVQLTIVISLCSETKKAARNYLLLSVLFNEILKFALGYYKLTGNIDLMYSVTNLFHPKYSFYGLISIAAVILLPIFAFIGAKRKSEYYSLKNEAGGVTVVRYTDSSIVNHQPGKRNLSPPAVVARLLLLIILISSIVFNSVILFAILGTSSKEFALFGYIPYVFTSSTMEPVIYKNDLVIFRKIDPKQSLSTGDIVLYKDRYDSTEVSVKKITEINGDNITVDFLKYPIPYSPDTLKLTVNRGRIYGLFYGESRILGTLINFVNTISGRILTMLLPAALLFFYTPIIVFLSRIKNRSDKEKIPKKDGI